MNSTGLSRKARRLHFGNLPPGTHQVQPAAVHSLSRRPVYFIYSLYKCTGWRTSSILLPLLLFLLLLLNLPAPPDMT